MGLVNSDDLDNIYDTLAKEQQKRQGYTASATPQLAQRVGQIHSQFPAVAGGVGLALAKAGVSDETIEKMYPSISMAALRNTVKEPEKKSWLERNVMDKVKTGSRYTWAALNYPLDFVQGGIAQAFDDNSSVAGWNIQTDLGSLIANDTQAGDGWVMGGKARELQAERARRYRGTIGGHGWTIGRGLASTVFEPDTFAFNLMSGVLDAATAIIVPTIPGSKAVGKAINALDELGKGGKFVSAGIKVMETTGRGSVVIKPSAIDATEIAAARAGILVGGSVDYKAANRWFGSGQATRVIERAAESDTFLKVWDLFGRKIEPELAVAIAKETDPNNIRLLLLDKLGQSEGLTNVKDFRGGNRAFVSLAARDKVVNALPLGQYVSRAYAKMPKRNINLFEAESPADQISALNTLDSMLKLSLVEPVAHAKLMNRAGELVLGKDEFAHGKFIDKLDEVIRVSATQAETTGSSVFAFANVQQTGRNVGKKLEVGHRVSLGNGDVAMVTSVDTANKLVGVDLIKESVAREVVDAVFDAGKKVRDNSKRYNLDDKGDPGDGGLFNRLFGGKAGSTSNTTFSGAQLASELGTHEYIIPDVRQLRHLTGTKMNWLYSKTRVAADENLDKLQKAGELRLPFAFVQHVQEDYWRPAITLTIGNFTRNAIDSQMMIALSHKPVSSLLRHPFHWLALLRKDIGFSDIYGRGFDEATLANAESAAQKAWKTSTTTLVGAQFRDPLVPYRRAQRLDTWKVSQRGLDSPADVVRAHADEIGLLNADWATRSMANGLSRDDIVALIRGGKDKKATEWYEAMAQRYKTGRETFDPTQPLDAQWSSQSIDLADDTNLLEVLSEAEQRLTKMTADNPDLIRAVGQGKLAAIMVDADLVLTKDPQIGQRVIYRTGKKGRAEGNVVGINTSSGKIDIEPFAYAEGQASKGMTDLLHRVYDEPKMPVHVGGEVINPNPAKVAGTKDALDDIVNRFHGTFYGKPIGTLERSPVFKQLYHDWIDKLAVSLDSQSVDKIIADISARAALDGKKPELFMNEKIWNKLLDIQSGKIKNYGTISAEELNAFASGQAIDGMMKLFYNAVERSNFTDTMRIISPFAQQWAEFIARIGRTALTPVAGGKMYLPDVNVLRKGQIVVQGAARADPDGDGRGLIYKDPSTGKMSFTFPLSGQLTKLVTGVMSPLNAPIKGAFMGFDYRPGLGPFATIAVSSLMPDSPTYDTARSVLLPFGEQKLGTGAFTPSWIRKMFDGAFGSSGSKVFMDTYVETMEALAGTSKYDLTNPEARDKLFQEARTKAKYLTVMRGIQQFLGPAAASYDQKVKAGELDPYVSELTQAFQEMKQADYGSSVSKFLEIFGEDAFVYMGRKTESVVGGLESSKEFGVFERTNKGLFRQYGDVAGYFGPVGSDHDLTVYMRQLNEGSRVKLSPEAVLESAEATIGSAYYRTMRKQFPATLNDEQREYVSTYRTALRERYRGYARMKFDPNKLPSQIEDITQAASLSSLDSNETALGVRYYMQVRDSALLEAKNRGLSGFSSKNAADLRDYLANYAQSIIEQYPEFARVYDRVLSQEVEE